MIYMLTAIGLPPGACSTVHIYTQTIQRTTQKQTVHRTTQKFWKSAGRAPSGELYPDICLTTEKKHGKTSVYVCVCVFHFDYLCFDK